MTDAPAIGGWSLRRRLLIWLFLSTALLGLIALTDTWFEARRTAQSVSDRVLAGSALAIAERVTVDLSGSIEVDIPFSALDMLASAAEDQVFYRIDGPDGFLTGYDTLPTVPRGAEDTAFADGRFGDTRIRIATLSGQVSTGEDVLPFAVTVAESTRARDALARAILIRSALRLSGLALGAALIVWITVTVALRPLDRLARTLQARAPDDLSPLQADIPSEVAGPIGAMNSFMSRLDGAVAALRNFTGNAGHQLRTPLATVRAQLALVSRLAPPEAQDSAAKAEAALIRAERVLAQLLMLARIDGAAARRALPATDIAAIARATTADAIPEATRHGHDLGFEGDDTLTARADPVLCAELLSNLVDNAIRYAGPRATITVRARATPAGPVLEVEDDGPGIPPDTLPRLLSRRDLRADAAQSGPQGTHGLGLAVVAEIARLFDAALDFQPATTGRGQIIRATFPLPEGD